MIEPCLKDGNPTGRLHQDLMEIECYIEEGNRRVRTGTRWVPITEEQRAKITGNAVMATASVSLDERKVDRVINDTNRAEYEMKNDLNINDTPAKEVVIDSLVKGQTVNLDLTTGKITSNGKVLHDPQTQGVMSSVPVNSALPEVRDDAVPGTYTAFTLKNNGEFVNHTKERLGLSPEAVAALNMQHFRPLTGHLEAVKALGPKDAELLQSMLPGGCCMDPEDKPTYSVEIGRGLTLPEDAKPEVKAENSGGNVNYYSVEIKHPKRKERVPYIFEVEDLIQALNLSFHEGTVLKSLIRSATERELGLKKLGNDSIRDAEKMVHSSTELLRARKLQRDKEQAK